MTVKGTLVTIIIIGSRLVKIEILKEFSGALQFRGRLDFKESDKNKRSTWVGKSSLQPFLSRQNRQTWDFGCMSTWEVKRWRPVLEENLFFVSFNERCLVYLRIAYLMGNFEVEKGKWQIKSGHYYKMKWKLLPNEIWAFWCLGMILRRGSNRCLPSHLWNIGMLHSVAIFLWFDLSLVFCFSCNLHQCCCCWRRRRW